VTVPLRSLRHRIEAAPVGLGLTMLRRLSPEAASNLGGAVARSIGPLLPVSKIAERNLRLALPELDAAARSRIIRGVWENLGRTVGELPHVARLRRTDPGDGPGWWMEGEEHIVALAKRGGPAILFSGHIGNWEVLPRALTHYGIHASTFYRAAANPLVDQTILRLRREALGIDIPVFPKGATGARQAMAHLSHKGFLGLLVDQKMNDGIAVPLFGHMAMTAPAAAAFALRYRCPLIPGHVERTAPAQFRLICEPPLPLPDTGDRQTDIATLTRAMNACLERWIRARPEGWLWLHRRWPEQPQPAAAA
jgi:KDO2-lipid IV(A) lauroyltransferase